MSALSRRAAFGAAAAALPVAGTAAAPVAVPCPAAEVARKIALVERAHHEADVALVTASPADKPAAERRFGAIDAELSGLCDALGTVQAASLPGAMAQMMRATSLALSGNMTATGGAAFAGLMLSAVTVAERLGGVRREEMAGDYFMSRHLDGTRGREDDDAPASCDAELAAMADEVLRLSAIYQAKGEFRDDLVDDITSEEATRLENAFYAEAAAAMNLAARMADTRANTMRGLEAKARVAMMYDREHPGWDKEEVFNLGRSLAADIERGVMPAWEA